MLKLKAAATPLVLIAVSAAAATGGVWRGK